MDWVPFLDMKLYEIMFRDPGTMISTIRLRTNILIRVYFLYNTILFDVCSSIDSLALITFTLHYDWVPVLMIKTNIHD